MPRQLPVSYSVIMVVVVMTEKALIVLVVEVATAALAITIYSGHDDCGDDICHCNNNGSDDE